MSLIATLTFALAMQPTTMTSEDADAAARVDAPANGKVAAIYDFDNDHVDGELMSPDGVPVPGAHQIRFPSLIQVRGTFIREMIRMADDV